MAKKFYHFCTHEQLRSLLIAASLLEQAAHHGPFDEYRKKLERIVTDLLDLRVDLQNHTYNQN